MNKAAEEICNVLKEHKKKRDPQEPSGLPESQGNKDTTDADNPGEMVTKDPEYTGKGIVSGSGDGPALSTGSGV